MAGFVPSVTMTPELLVVSPQLIWAVKSPALPSRVGGIASLKLNEPMSRFPVCVPFDGGDRGRRVDQGVGRVDDVDLLDVEVMDRLLAGMLTTLEVTSALVMAWPWR